PVSDVFFPWSPEPNPIVAHSDGVTLTFFALHNGFEFEFSGSSNALKRLYNIGQILSISESLETIRPVNNARHILPLWDNSAQRAAEPKIHDIFFPLSDFTYVKDPPTVAFVGQVGFQACENTCPIKWINFKFIVGGQTDVIKNSSLFGAKKGKPYSFRLSASGGAPYVWGITSGGAPGLKLLPSTGVLEGTPTKAGNFPISVKVTNAFHCVAWASYTLHVS
ncbi:MAG TPA: Ig domain-containing protein, partial [Acidimicrobiales bacterium]|nr:Ig domain-containing protein [Acidimicrobiales bacterium]